MFLKIVSCVTQMRMKHQHISSLAVTTQDIYGLPYYDAQENPQVKTWNEEVYWMSKRTWGCRARQEILGWLFAATVYHVQHGMNEMPEGSNRKSKKVHTN